MGNYCLPYRAIALPGGLRGAAAPLLSVSCMPCEYLGMLGVRPGSRGSGVRVFCPAVLLPCPGAAGGGCPLLSVSCMPCEYLGMLGGGLKKPFSGLYSRIWGLSGIIIYSEYNWLL